MLSRVTSGRLGPLVSPPAVQLRPLTAEHRADLRRTLRARDAAGRRAVPTAEHAIVVFGAPARADGTPAPPLEARLEGALAAHRRDPDAVIVVSGGAVKGARESTVMRRWLEARGVPSGAIVEERAARFTLENAELSAALVRSTGAARVSLVTERFHMARAGDLMQAALQSVGASARLTRLATSNASANPKRDRGEVDKRNRDLSSQTHLHRLASEQPISPPNEWVF